MRRPIPESPDHGEGHRKAQARLRSRCRSGRLSPAEPEPLARSPLGTLFPDAHVRLPKGPFGEDGIPWRFPQLGCGRQGLWPLPLAMKIPSALP